MSDRPIVLTFNRCYLPGYRAGGPIKTIENMVDRLSDYFDFRIVTLDRDSGSNSAYEGIDPGEWHALGKAKVMYLSRELVSIRRLAEIFEEVSPQMVYLNSYFDSVFTQRMLVARRTLRLGRVPVVLAPRGEFSSGALELKRLKKSIYIHFSRAVGLYRSLVWQASSDLEKQDILARLSWVCERNVKVAIDLAPEIKQLDNRFYRKDNAPLRVCFLSRISPMKNLDYALQVLKEVKVPVVFSIYGPKEVPSYWEKCVKIISSLPKNIDVQYLGPVPPSLVGETLAKHDLFFLPTMGENYGHVIFEALSAGLPVLISNRTQWKSLEQIDIGWEYPLEDLSAFAEKISDIFSWEEKKHSEVAARAIEYATRLSNDEKAIRRNRDLFTQALTGAAV